jgi:hypothetical protein
MAEDFGHQGIEIDGFGDVGEHAGRQTAFAGFGADVCGDAEYRQPGWAACSRPVNW